MKEYLIRIIMLTTIFTVTTGLVYLTVSPNPTLATENVKIDKDANGIWRVMDDNGVNKGMMKVKPMDKVNWHAKDSDMVFTFSKDVNAYFSFESGLFADGKTQKIAKSMMLKVTLKDNAPKDSLVYEVYVVDADAYVVGNSPPVLIVN